MQASEQGAYPAPQSIHHPSGLLLGSQPIPPTLLLPEHICSTPLCCCWCIVAVLLLPCAQYSFYKDSSHDGIPAASAASPTCPASLQLHTLTSSLSFVSQAFMRTRGSLSSSCNRCSTACTICKYNSAASGQRQNRQPALTCMNASSSGSKADPRAERPY
jgi:hypothetical protein